MNRSVAVARRHPWRTLGGSLVAAWLTLAVMATVVPADAPGGAVLRLLPGSPGKTPAGGRGVVVGAEVESWGSGGESAGPATSVPHRRVGALATGTVEAVVDVVDQATAAVVVPQAAPPPASSTTVTTSAPDTTMAPADVELPGCSGFDWQAGPFIPTATYRVWVDPAPVPAAVVAFGPVVAGRVYAARVDAVRAVYPWPYRDAPGGQLRFDARIGADLCALVALVEVEAVTVYAPT